MRYKNILIIALATIIQACNEPPELKLNEYMLWVENKDNLCNQSKESENIVMSCFYMPKNYIINKEIQNKVLSVEDLAKRRGELENILIFKINLTQKTGSLSLQKRTEQLPIEREYFRYSAENDIYLKYNNKYIKPDIFQLIRNNGLEIGTEFIVSFYLKDPASLFSLGFDNKLDSTKFLFDFNKKEIPQLRT